MHHYNHTTAILPISMGNRHLVTEAQERAVLEVARKEARVCAWVVHAYVSDACLVAYVCKRECTSVSVWMLACVSVHLGVRELLMTELHLLERLQQ